MAMASMMTGVTLMIMMVSCMILLPSVSYVNGWHIRAAPAPSTKSMDPLPNRYHNEKGTFSISWSFPTSDIIEVEFTAAGTGWVGIGFGGSMFKSDMIVGYVATNGSTMIGDYWSAAHETPKSDESLGGRNDVKIVSGSSAGGLTTLRFRRLLVTGDTFDVPIKPSGTTDLVYAWRNGNPGEIKYHGVDNHNHVQLDLSRADGIPDSDFGREEVGYGARQLINMTTYGTLITVQEGTPGVPDPKFKGFPYGSVASFADESPSTGYPLLLLSQLERNIINFNADSRCTLAVAWPADKLGDTDPMAAPRVTLLGTLTPVPAADIPKARATYLARHPSAVWIDFKDFQLYRFNASDIYFIGGFGGEHYIGWVDVRDYYAQIL